MRCFGSPAISSPSMPRSGGALAPEGGGQGGGHGPESCGLSMAFQTARPNQDV
jgi:hypothetical protein